MNKPTRQDYDVFNWLPVNRWNEDNLCGPRLNHMIMCKICDTYIRYDERVDHVAKHVIQRKRQLAADRKQARLKRLEAARLARQMKKEMAGNS